MFWVPAFAGMTCKTDRLDKSNPYFTPTLIPLKRRRFAI